jgi:hypothetical protein
MITVTFTEAEVNEIRKALAAQENGYRGHGFVGLANQASELRSKIANAVIDSKIVSV